MEKDKSFFQPVITSYSIHYTKLYEKEPLRFYDCDYKCRMKLSAILKRSAEIAGRDYTLKGFGHEALWEKQMVFLLSRVSARIFNYPHEQSDLTTRTWEHGTKGAMFLRNNFV